MSRPTDHSSRLHVQENPEPDYSHLRAPLTRLAHRPVEISSELDARIMRIARHHLEGLHEPALARIGPVRPAGWRWGGLAAAVALAASMGLAFLQVTAPGGGFARYDLTRSGHVDILDAFHLARQLEAKTDLPVRYDINRDGLVDWRDVDELARFAVSLDRTGRRDS